MGMVRLSLTILSILSCVILMVACQEKPEASLSDSGKGINAKLSSDLNQLVQAESRGEATPFAKQHNIELIENKVRVVVEVLPGQIDAVTKAVSAVGTIETSYQNLLQALVPIKNLTDLTHEPGIEIIRLPMQPFPDSDGGNIR